MPNKTHQFDRAVLPPEQSDTSLQTSIKQILALVELEYLTIPKKIRKIFTDIVDLYEGRWPQYQACQVGYHNIQHAIAVTLAAVRMASGWNSVHSDKKIPLSVFKSGIAAALFHDSGYLKDKDDTDGTGGKFTFSHVGRSQNIAITYLQENDWKDEEIFLVNLIIDITEFGIEPDMNKFVDEHQLLMAKMVASADLIAQMADINYLHRLQDLHQEFMEGYDAEGRDNLKKRSIHIFESFQEMLDNTPAFYEKFVLPRLDYFGRMDQYLVAFFGDGRNPYFENITANISGQLLNNRVQWQKLGDILLDQGLVDKDTISEALQKQTVSSPGSKPPLQETIREHLISWLGTQIHDHSRLGNILMEMDAVDPETLRKGLLSQLLPDNLVQRLSRDELLYLLQIALLVQNVYDDPWVFGQILEMTIKLLKSTSGSLLLADAEKTELLVAVHSGKRKDKLEGKTIPLDKGISGWVFRHTRAAFVTRAHVDDHFFKLNSDDGEDIHSILAVPVHINGETIGVVEVMNKQGTQFDDHDADILTLLANVMACSLSMVSRLHDKK